MPLGRYAAAGRLACWGMNEDGQLGIGTFTGAELYTDSIPLVDELPWIGVAAGAATTCAISGLLEEGVDCPRGPGSGNVYCWGNNGSSEFGPRGQSTPSSSSPEMAHVVAAPAATPIQG
ncbi:MAG: RCC1 domain-containing protein, partial [Myxococcota bacterium]